MSKLREKIERLALQARDLEENPAIGKFNRAFYDGQRDGFRKCLAALDAEPEPLPPDADAPSVLAEGWASKLAAELYNEGKGNCISVYREPVPGHKRVIIMEAGDE